MYLYQGMDIDFAHCGISSAYNSALHLVDP